MESIYQKALGTTFQQLHPEMQKKYGLTSEQNIMVLGQGRMTEIRGTNLFFRPFLQIGVRDHLVFAERGRNVPFTLENYAYTDDRGRETVSWIRRFFFPYSIRGFDASMYFDETKGKIVDEMGKKGRLQVELDVHVTAEGGLYMESGQMTYKGNTQLPAPKFEFYEHYEEEEEAYRVHVHISHSIFGTLLMYEGLVHAEFLPMTYSNIPERGFLE